MSAGRSGFTVEASQVDSLKAEKQKLLAGIVAAIRWPRGVEYTSHLVAGEPASVIPQISQEWGVSTPQYLLGRNDC